MDSQTWTEYAVRYSRDDRVSYTSPSSYDDAKIDRDFIAANGFTATIVGRTVSATGWLPAGPPDLKGLDNAEQRA